MIAYTLNKYGLRVKDMNYMFRLFESIPAIQKVILFGSRAMGSFERGSDVDIAVVGEDITFREISRIHSLLEEESPTLLGFDVVHYDTLSNEALRLQIDEFGKVIYQMK